MKRRIARLTHLACWTVLLGNAPILVSPARAESSNKVVLVEEHWELTLSQPDSDRSAPQTTMVMSPIGDVSGIHFLFTLNHAAAPDYAPGGMQLQAWDGDQFVDHQESDESESLSHSDEVVTWVQRISLNDGQIKFQVREGHSETWGTFGGDSLSLTHETNLNSLNRYKPSVSLAESQVNYAENRVASLVLKKLVWVTEDGQVHEQNAPIPLDTSLDSEEESP